MNKYLTQIAAGVLTIALVLDPVTAAGFSCLQSPSPISVVKSLPTQTIFETEALITACDFIVKPALMARHFSARVYHMTPLRHVPPATVGRWALFGGGVFSLLGLWVYRNWSLLTNPRAGALAYILLGGSAILMWPFSWRANNPDKDAARAKKAQERRVKDRENQLWTLWEKSTVRHLNDTRTESGITPDLTFMKDSWGGPVDFIAIQWVAYGLAGSLLEELEDHQGLSLTEAERVMRGILRAVEKYPHVQKFDVRRPSDYEERPAESKMHAYAYPNPYLLKPLLIKMQLGQLHFDNQASEEDAFDRVSHLLKNPVLQIEEDKQILEQGFPRLPPGLEERKVLLRTYLLRLAEQAGSPFDVRAIEKLLSDSALIEDLPDGPVEDGKQVLIVDPYTWNPLRQWAQPIGVLPRKVAQELLACQLAYHAFIQLDDVEDKAINEFALVVRAESKTQGGTWAIPSGKAYFPNTKLSDVLRKTIVQQMGFPEGYELKGELEFIGAIDPPVFGGREGKDIQLFFTAIYHATPEDKVWIEQEKQRLDTIKLDYAGEIPGFEKAWAARVAEEGGKPPETRSIIKLPLFEIVRRISEAWQFGVDTNHRAQRGLVHLVEEFGGGRKNSIAFPPNLDVLMRILRENSPVLGRLMDMHGRRGFESSFDKKIAAITRLKERLGPEAVRVIDAEGHLMQSRWEPHHRRFGMIMEVIAPVVEEYERQILGVSLSDFIAGHIIKLRTHHIKEDKGWIGPEHEAYPAALQRIRTIARAIDITVSEFTMFGRWGRFAYAVVLHIWSSSIKPRMGPALLLRSRLYAGFSA